MKSVLGAIVAAGTLAFASDAGKPIAPQLKVWWDRDYFQELKTVADCDAARLTWNPTFNRGLVREQLRVEMTMPDDSKRTCATLADWTAARDAGGYAYSTRDMVDEGVFRERHLAYSVLPHLMDAKRSGFQSDGWVHDARHFVLCEDQCVDGKRPRCGDREWEFRPNIVVYRDEQEFEFVRVIGRGDYDGDGWQDELAFTSGGSTQGSLCYFTERLFTRRGEGRIIDASVRMLVDRCSAHEVARHRAALADSFGLPEGVPIVLTGQMRAGDKALDLECSITVVDSFVTGDYAYARIGKPIPIEGTLGRENALVLNEYALDPMQPNAVFSMTWKREGDRISAKGHWCEAIEGNEVTLSGLIPPATGK